MKKTLDLVAIGGAYVDINCTQFPFDDHGLLPEKEVVGDTYEVVPGGSALNFVRFCANLGLQTAFVGKVGQDRMGLLLKELLQESGVRPEFVSDANTTTNISLNFVNPEGKSIMAVAGNAKHHMTNEEVAERVALLLPATEYFMLGGAFKLRKLLPSLRHIFTAARALKTKTIIDHGRLVSGITAEQKELIKNLALQADYYFPSRDEFQQLWSVASIEEGLRKVADQSQVTVIVKDSSNGAFTLLDSKIVHVPAFAVQATNTIGAGDSFNAGFIVARKRGMNVVDSMRFACATAALKISQTALPTYQAVTNFMQTHKD